MNILNQETGLELQSKEINELAKALTKAQGAMTSAQKDGTNPHFGKSYATLDSIWQATRKPLCDNGLSVVQSLLPDNVLVTILMHESGQWMRSYLKLNPVRNDPQGLGSALTYGRRYSLAAMVGIAQADDDGEGGSEAPDQRKSKPRPERVEGPTQQGAVSSKKPAALQHWSADETKRDKIASNVAKLGATMEMFFDIHGLNSWEDFSRYEGEPADAWAYFKEQWTAKNGTPIAA